MKKLFTLTLLVVLTLTACGQAETDSADLPNPAAVYCQEQGGVLQSIYSPDGEDALCVFDNGSHCWQWDYHNGECEVGECFRECRAIGSKSEGWYDTCGGILIEWAPCSKNPDWQVEITPVVPSEDSEDDEDSSSADSAGSPQASPEPSEEPETPVSSTPTQNKNIIVTTPTSDQTVNSPFLVTGQAKVFEGTINLRIKKPSGDILIQEIATAHALEVGDWGNFSVNLHYAFQSTKEGMLEVYSIDAATGQEENLVGIPLKFE